jgi:hypothetical protein
MSLFSWLRKQTSPRSTRWDGLQIRRRAPRFRPRLEALEDRCLLSTLTVTSAADSGGGSLRADIAAAHSGDTIVFAPSLVGKTITLTSGELVVSKSLTIQGPGAGQLAISGGNVWGVFEMIGLHTNVTLSGLTITQGRAGSGGGIFNNATLTVSGSTFQGNQSIVFGGGIWNVGTLTVSDSTFFANHGPDGGGIYNRGTATLTNCTFSNNSAGYGGGMLIGGGTATLTNCTFSNNSASQGGGIDVVSGGILNLTNTIVAGNTATTAGLDIYGAVTTADHNLVGDATGSTGLVNGVNGNIVGGNGNPVINALLGPLQNNGGPTQTMALLPGSRAIGHGNNAKAPATDERGVTRIDETGETTDIGAFEL